MRRSRALSIDDPNGRVPRALTMPDAPSMPESHGQREVGVVVAARPRQCHRARVRQHAAEPRARERRTAACCSRACLRAYAPRGPGAVRRVPPRRRRAPLDDALPAPGRRDAAHRCSCCSWRCSCSGAAARASAACAPAEPAPGRTASFVAALGGLFARARRSQRRARELLVKQALAPHRRAPPPAADAGARARARARRRAAAQMPPRRCADLEQRSAAPREPRRLAAQSRALDALVDARLQRRMRARARQRAV